MKSALLLTLPLTLLLVAPALAAPVAMEDLVTRGLARSPALAQAQYAAEAQASLEGVARAAWFPQVSLTGSLAQTTSVSPAQTVAQPFSLSATAIAVRQTLFTFGKVAAAVEVAEAQTAALKSQAALAAVEVAYGVRQSYLAWNQAHGLEAQVGQQVKVAEATLAEARARFKSGVAPRLDVTRAEATLGSARSALATARATTAQARRTLGAALGDTVAVTGDPAFPDIPAVAGRPEATLRTEANEHPSLLASRAQVAQAQAQSRAADRAGLPDLNADASYGIRARDFVGAPNWQAGVSAVWPLFTGFAVTSRAEAARRSADSASAALEATRLAILRDVDNAMLALGGAKQALPPAKQAIDAARANLQQAQGRYREGVGSIVEVSDAQSLIANAQADWVRASTQYHLAVANLQRALGLTGATR